jgi:hypothetical protein
VRFNSSWPGIKPFVMAGLVPAIHVFVVARPQDVDARHKAGHDGGEVVARDKAGQDAAIVRNPR